MFHCHHDDNSTAHYESSKFDVIAVGCCYDSDDDGTVSGRRPQCGSHPATYDDAVGVCFNDGGRLCSLQEMLSGVTAGEGCLYDAAYLWVADECVGDGPMIHDDMLHDVKSLESK